MLTRFVDGEKPFATAFDFAEQASSPEEKTQIARALREGDDETALSATGEIYRRMERRLGPKKAAEGAEKRPAWESPDLPFPTRALMAKGLAHARATGDEAKRKPAWERLEKRGLPPAGPDAAFFPTLMAGLDVKAGERRRSSFRTDVAPIQVADADGGWEALAEAAAPERGNDREQGATSIKGDAGKGDGGEIDAPAADWAAAIGRVTDRSGKDFRPLIADAAAAAARKIDRALRAGDREAAEAAARELALHAGTGFGALIDPETDPDAAIGGVSPFEPIWAVREILPLLEKHGLMRASRQGLGEAAQLLDEAQRRLWKEDPASVIAGEAAMQIATGGGRGGVKPTRIDRRTPAGRLSFRALQEMLKDKGLSAAEALDRAAQGLAEAAGATGPKPALASAPGARAVLETPVAQAMTAQGPGGGGSGEGGSLRGGGRNSLRPEERLPGFDPTMPETWPSKIDWPNARKEKKLGGGGEKDVYAYPDREGGEFAIGMRSESYTRGDFMAALKRNVAALDEARRRGVKTIDAKIVSVNGEPALLMRRIEGGGSKEVVKAPTVFDPETKQPVRNRAGRKEKGPIQIIGESRYLNENSIRDLETLQEVMRRENISIEDLQFLIGKDGSLYVADILGVKDGGPSRNNKRIIRELVTAARANIENGEKP